VLFVLQHSNCPNFPKLFQRVFGPFVPARRLVSH
jgi:hypothetical protein